MPHLYSNTRPTKEVRSCSGEYSPATWPHFILVHWNYHQDDGGLEVKDVTIRGHSIMGMLSEQDLESLREETFQDVVCEGE